MMTVSLYFALYSSGVIFFFPPLKSLSFVDQLPIFHPVKPLVGRPAVQPAQLFIIATDFQVIQQRKQRLKRLNTVTAAVQTGFLSKSSDDFQCLQQFRKILAFSHEADA